MTSASSNSCTGPNDFRLCREGALNEEAVDGFLRAVLEVLLSVRVDCDDVEEEVAIPVDCP